jgi:hypothetical protein
LPMQHLKQLHFYYSTIPRQSRRDIGSIGVVIKTPLSLSSLVLKT